ncbi:MAG: T9SS type A sorting domain-containing protein [Candidatus Marinimicrobia bacterium]|nr:T9SS type A sorting domain-containing protein [Candidatus Neomarinimicrobiota bacterium]
MKKLLIALTCLMFAVTAFGQWDMVKGPVDISYPDDAVALDATTMLTVMDNIVMKTTDFGASWTKILLPEGVNARAIDAVGDFVYVSADDGLVFKSVDAGDTWASVGDSTFTLDMCVIDVFDSNKVFIGADDGYFFKTLDGGTSWDTTVMATDDDLDGGVAFTSALNGIVFDDGTAGIIHVTDDGGDTWSDFAITAPIGAISKRMYTCAAAGSSTFIVAGYHNMRWISTDNGATWELKGEISYGYDRIVRVQAFDENNFFALNSVSDVFTTTDGGTTWDTLAIGSSQSGQAIAFSSMTNGMIWTSYGQEYSTVDGSTFVPMHEWPGIPFYSITIPSEGKLIATANYGGEISISEDNGATWSYPTNAETGAKSSIYASVSIDENTILLGGSAGYIGKSVDGGDTYTIIDNPMAQLSNKHIYFLYVAPDGDVYAGGSSGMLMVSDDDGDTWTELESGTAGTIYGMSVFSNGMGFLGASSGRWCMSKTTALDTFEQVADMGTMNIRGAKERNGVILVPANDDVYKMNEDYDSLYSVFDIPDGSDAYALEWVSDTVAFIVGSNGIIYRTDDAGETWEQELSGADDYIYDLKYDGEKLWAVGRYALIMSRDYMPTEADFVEEFTDGTADLTWVENPGAANTGGLNLAVVADSAGLSNVGIYTDDGYTGVIYADTDKKLKSFEVSADIYLVKDPDLNEALYKGLNIMCDDESLLYYRFIYRNSSSSDNGILKLQGYNGSWHISKTFYPGVDFDTLTTGFHNFKAQVVDSKFWVYIDDVLLPGCPYEDASVITEGYPGIYVYNTANGKVAFDNFMVNVYEYPKYAVTANVDMGVMVRRGEFDVVSNNLDVMGSFDGWTDGVDMTDIDGDTVWSAPIGEHEAGTTIYYKYRRNGAWDNTEEFPYGGPAREYVVLDEADQQMPAVLYGDITEVAIDGVPNTFALEQNYPNPFNPATTLKFQIPNTEMVNISIYNVAGRKVAEVMNAQLEAGYYSVNFNASVLPSGVYLYRITAGEFNAVKKMTLLK